jgi:hypothetical protein
MVKIDSLLCEEWDKRTFPRQVRFRGASSFIEIGLTESCVMVSARA